MVEGDVPAIGGLLRVLAGLVGHEPRRGFGHQPFQLGVADLVREPRDLGIDEPGGLEGQGEGGLGDPAGPPRGEVTAQHPAPGAGQPVLQLHRGR